MDNQTPPATNPTNNPHAVQTPPPSPKSFFSTKIIILILFALIIVGANGTFFMLNSNTKTIKPDIFPTDQSPIPTNPPLNKEVNINVISKTFFNLSFQVPKDWTEITPVDINSIAYLSPDAKFNQESGQVPVKGAAIYIQKQEKTIPADCREYASEEPEARCIKISNNEFLNIQITNERNGYQNIYILIQNDSQFIFSILSSSSSEAKKYEVVLDSLLNSIKN